MQLIQSKFVCSISPSILPLIFGHSLKIEPQWFSLQHVSGIIDLGNCVNHPVWPTHYPLQEMVFGIASI